VHEAVAIPTAPTAKASPTKSEWDVVSTSGYEGRESFQIAREGPSDGNPDSIVARSIMDLDPYAPRERRLTGLRSPKAKSKLRKRSSFGLPLPPSSYGGAGTGDGREEGRGSGTWMKRFSNGFSISSEMLHLHNQHRRDANPALDSSTSSAPSTSERRRKSSVLPFFLLA
jgi:hypothetical protein